MLPNKFRQAASQVTHQATQQVARQAKNLILIMTDEMSGELFDLAKIKSGLAVVIEYGNNDNPALDPGLLAYGYQDKAVELKTGSHKRTTQIDTVYRSGGNTQLE